MNVEYHKYHNPMQKIVQNIRKRKSCVGIIIGISLFLQYIIISVDAQNQPPTLGRWGHAAVLINNSLYVYGGNIVSNPTVEVLEDVSVNTNVLMSLDITSQFDIKNPPWVLLSSGELSLASHTCNIGGNQNELLFLFGGEPKEQATNTLYVYNTKEKKWVTTSTPIENSPPRIIDHTMVTRLNDSISYLWGGTPIGDQQRVTALGDLYKLNTIGTISWENLPDASQIAVGRFQHSATLLNDGKMYIIGGSLSGVTGGEQSILASITEIPVYDTNAATWTVQNAAGIPPNPRKLHRAVGTADGRIIIYGGVTAKFDQIFDDVAVLKTGGSGLEWSIPQILGDKPPGRYSHTMTMVGSKVIVTYGRVNDFTFGTKLFVLNAKNTDTYTWESTYTPIDLELTNTIPDATRTDPNGTNGGTESNSISENNSGSNSNIIIGASVGGLVLLIIITVLICLVRRRRKKQHSFAATPYDKQQASVPPIAGHAPLHNLNYAPSSLSQGGAGGTTNVTDVTSFTPPFATQNSVAERRNLTPVDQHDSWGSAPSNSSQSQLAHNTPYYATDFLSRGDATAANTKPPSNLRLDSDSNTAPAEFDFNLPPVAPLSINLSSPTEMDTSETTSSSTDEGGGVGGLFNSPLFRTEALSALAGTASAADRTLSLRSVPRLNTSGTPRNSATLSSPPPLSAGGRLRSGTWDGQKNTFEGGITGSNKPTSPIDNSTSDNKPPRGRLFAAKPDSSDDSD
ncbi:12805_t:CDS:2 [Funneliformis mosseae]|uniref:12805_t:CDS:1 n=1 Tax=Funneliformis mosseae TaxID=27381 RepID=A0A9N9DKG8_FUNMO|nr:12805_t:CDS:2 [Funneliformis mosseae]